MPRTKNSPVRSKAVSGGARAGGRIGGAVDPKSPGKGGANAMRQPRRAMKVRTQWGVDHWVQGTVVPPREEKTQSSPLCNKF